MYILREIKREERIYKKHPWDAGSGDPKDDRFKMY